MAELVGRDEEAPRPRRRALDPRTAAADVAEAAPAAGTDRGEDPYREVVVRGVLAGGLGPRVRLGLDHAGVARRRLGDGGGHEDHIARHRREPVRRLGVVVRDARACPEEEGLRVRDGRRVERAVVREIKQHDENALGPGRPGAQGRAAEGTRGAGRISSTSKARRPGQPVTETRSPVRASGGLANRSGRISPSSVSSS